VKRIATIVAMCAAGATLAGAGALAQSPAPQPPPVGEMKALGDDRFQIARIVVDKRAGRFTVPGRVHVTNVPLEYLATAPQGMKAYETLFELDATGSELNLACLLVGLDRAPNQPAYQPRSQGSLAGPRVTISVAWSEGGKRRQLSAAEALLGSETAVKPQSVEWVYTGAPSTRPGGPFAPDVTGTLIGFVHDPNTIIESVVPIGVGAYGSVRGNAALPPVGASVELIVEVVQAKR
jgi:hypothetical protein